MLPQILSMLTPLLLITLGCAFAIAFYFKRARANYHRTSAMKDLPRLPAQSLQDQLEDSGNDFDASFALGFFAPLIVYAVLSQKTLDSDFDRILAPIAYVLSAVAIYNWVFFNFKTYSHKLRTLSAGIQGELAPAIELQNLDISPFELLHDIKIPGKEANIDHLLICPAGVFTIETKHYGRLKQLPEKPRNPDLKPNELRVNHHTKTLQFPDRNIQLPLDQLEAQARFIKDKLFHLTGTKIPVTQLLATPGWSVLEDKPLTQRLVFNPRNSTVFFANRPQTLTSEQVKIFASHLSTLNLST